MKESILQWCATAIKQQGPHRSHRRSISHHRAVKEPARGSGKFAHPHHGPNSLW